MEPEISSWSVFFLSFYPSIFFKKKMLGQKDKKKTDQLLISGSMGQDRDKGHCFTFFFELFPMKSTSWAAHEDPFLFIYFDPRSCGQ